MTDVRVQQLEKRVAELEAEVDRLNLSLGDCGNAMMAEGHKALRFRDALVRERERSEKLLEILQSIKRRARYAKQNSAFTDVVEAEWAAAAIAAYESKT